MTIREIAIAIYVINNHAKNAPILYSLKYRAIQQLLKEGRAEKIGLQYSPNPGKALRRLDVLVRIEDFFFHQPSTKEDRRTLKVVERDSSFRNPKERMSIFRAKQIINAYSPPKKSSENRKNPLPKQQTPYTGFSAYLNGTYK
ncbi:YkyB family protein [Fictibacillus sp. S7]|uniref:YkyB family protein n=1 Tax=Fictibacillus sp. S7 TaxID=2212476 RepID=UPI0010128971|nr:YkyB family protein [Fictibacillus sp. S7]RXZ01506.1 hypothetical protein DMO16_18675 [Fictibacillus sp. S7]